MIVKRIVPNIAAPTPAAARAFYGDVLGLETVMDRGWIVTFASGAATTPQISVASDGGAGAAVPDLSIEVDDLDEVERRLVRAGVAIVHGPVAEAWGVRRLFVRDPFGRLVNILTRV